jgi:hypothetical protein
MVALIACGSSTSTGPAGAASVSVQQSDLPKALQRCSESGDMQAFLKAIQTKDPATYDKTKAQWDAAQKDGAVAAAVAFYADSGAHCAAMESPTTDFSGVTYPVIINFVIQFGDEASAVKGYTTESIFGFKQSDIATSPGVLQGTKTGLTPNSVSLPVSIGNQSFYVAFWQNKAYMVILGVLNMDLTASKKIAISENSRIR